MGQKFSTTALAKAAERDARQAANRIAWAERQAEIQAHSEAARGGRRAVSKLGRYLDTQRRLAARKVERIDPRLMTDAQLVEFVKAAASVDKYDWDFYCRPDQREPSEYEIWLLLAGRGFGKGLTFRTPIATPSGWTTMGELRNGDAVLDEAGQACRVTRAHEPYMPERLYRLTLSDGTKITADGEHQWVTWTHRDRKQLNRSSEATKFPENWPSFRGQLRSRWGNTGESFGPEIRTTDEIVKTFMIGIRGDTNHCIPLCGSLDLPAAGLLVEPYILGAWLGDGHSAGASLTCGDTDREHLEAAVIAAGYRVGLTRPSNPITFGVIGGLRRDLAVLGLLRNKHVPAVYLRGSVEQRQALLQGLMDTDGHIGPKNGHVEFCNTNERLADGVVELARSLGQKPVKAESRAMLYGKDCGPRWRVTWRPTVQCFRLPRKAEQWRPAGAQSLRNHHRMIVAFEEIEPEMVRCITVDSPNSMYLAGEGMIPTHNTRTCAEVVRKVCEKPNQRVAVIAKDHRALRDVCFEGVSGLIACIPPHLYLPKNYNKGLGDVGLTLLNGSIIKGYTAAEPDAVRGQAFDIIWGDEFAAWPLHRAEDMLTQVQMCLRESENPRCILSTTPKRVPHVVKIIEDSKDSANNIVITRGRSRDNTALNEKWHQQMERTYGGTRMGRQELEGELVMDNEHALWTFEMIEIARFGAFIEDDGKDKEPIAMPKMIGVITGVDPSGSSDGDATGIVTVGWDKSKALWVLDNQTRKGTPAERYTAVCLSAWKHGSAYIYFESAYGGDNCAFGIKNQWDALVREGVLPVSAKCPPIRPSKIRGDKAARAMPIVARYEMQMTNPDVRRIFHVAETADNNLAKLTEEMTMWETNSTRSPNAIDALVHAATQVLVATGQFTTVSSPVSPHSTRKRPTSRAYNPFAR